MKFSFILILAISVFVLSNCTQHNIEELSKNTVCDTSGVKYSTTISSIMTNHCTNCHGGTSPSAGISLEGFANVSSWAEASLASMQDGSMPKGASKLDNCTISKLSVWINQGKQNN